MKNIVLAASLFVTAGAANAADLTLSTAFEGATISHGAVDMSVYYTDVENGFEVVATYVARETATTPDQLVMVLADGDAVSFGLPGVSGQVYTFARDGESVTVDAAYTWTQVAEK